MKQPDIIFRNALRTAAAICNLCSVAAVSFLQRVVTGNTLLRRTAAACVAVALLFVLAGCSDDAGDPEVTASVPLLEIRAGIDAPVTLASATAWSPGDAIGISSAASGKVQHNVKYITENGDGVFVPAHPDTAISIRKGEGTVKLYAYYPFIGQNGAFPSAIDKTLYTITPDDQTPERQPSIDLLFATATFAQSNVDLQFRHKMSRIVLNFEAGNGLDRLGDMECSFGNVRTSFFFYRAAGNIEPDITSLPGRFSVSLPSGITTASFLFFPQNPGIVLPFNIEMNGETYTTTGLPLSNGLESGMEYVFTVRVSDRRVTISASSSACWNQKEDTEDITSTPV